MPDPTDAEIQAGANAIARSWRVLSPTSRRHLAKLVLSAVLPGHDAQLRAELAASTTGAGGRTIPTTGNEGDDRG